MNWLGWDRYKGIGGGEKWGVSGDLGNWFEKKAIKT